MVKSKRAIVIVGTSLNYAGFPIADVNYKIEDIKKMAARMFGGYSVSQVTGGWFNGHNALVEDKSLRFEIFHNTEQGNTHFDQFASYCKRVLEQEAVLVSVQDVDTFKFV